jgi:pilus assembly protein CpaF
MANDSETPKFPPPIPNPLKPKTTVVPSTRASAEASALTAPSPIGEEEKTDPGLANEGAGKPAKPKPLNSRMPEMGLLADLMKDPDISEIMVNDIRNVMIEKGGQLTYSGITYTGIDELNRLTRNILDITGRILSPDSPYVDTMLPDGSRVNIVGPPLTLYGPCLTIRKFPEKRLEIEDLILAGTLDQKIAQFMRACVVGKLNILVSGGTGSGKTTLLNALISFIPKQERIVTIEDTPELIVDHSNSVRLQIKPQTPASAPVTARDLVANSLRMRPDRVLVGECRRAEAFDMLQVMNTGHQGSMTTIHANSPRDGLSRLETLCMMAGSDLPILAIRRQIASAIDLIVQIKRLRSGARRVTAMSEITGMEGDTMTLQDIFVCGDDYKIKPTGFVPTILERLKESGIEIPHHFFG